ncbi:DUF397 domain-containing protein [Actinomadura sp. KC06]|uniref:DUF397 domain-containing protein n=1 Tax=Actinomadura sp. KC06 TaxID=2530369 RepID=UPI001050EF61|nr:DUF397 domain-containing protein [Actinomadura sp. KC06]TDD29982.1 DUF397 domain-containing protein [Actinomadura sp. KC06]
MSMGPRWQKSSYCMNASDCVELARLRPDTIGIRDSKQAADDGPILAFSAPVLESLITRIKRGALDNG